MSGSVIIDAKVKMKRERDKTMKILGLSFGKKNANCDILTKEALYGAREAYPDAEIKFINTQRLNIGRCIGCGACSTALEKGKDNNCIIKDDFQMLENEVRAADAIILAAPVYVLQPVGQFKDFVDRFSCRHDVSAINWVLDKRRSGEMPGDPDEFPQERLKRRTVSYISVGGASTENWTSMGTASLHLFGFVLLLFFPLFHVLLFLRFLFLCLLCCHLFLHLLLIVGGVHLVRGEQLLVRFGVFQQLLHHL